MKSKIETLEVAGLYPAIIGMRAPMKSYKKCDSVIGIPAFNNSSLEDEDNDSNNEEDEEIVFSHLIENTQIGENDYSLAKRLAKSGTEHRKWMRQVEVWAKVTLPIYVWSEWDTYKISTVANSESTMHTITKRNLTWDDFEEVEGYDYGNDLICGSIFKINSIIGEYKKLKEEIDQEKEKKKNHPDWDQSDEYRYQKKLEDSQRELENIFITIKSLLPGSFLQTRFVSLNYETLHNMYHQRKNHRLPQWKELFCNWVETLPYSEFITEKFDE